MLILFWQEWAADSEGLDSTNRKDIPGSIDPEGCQALAKRVAVDLESRPDLAIHLRADREVHFEWIQPIMETLRAASAHVEGTEAKVHLVLLEPAS